MTTDELIAAWAEFAGPASVAYKRHPIVAPLVYAGDTLAAALREREGPRGDAARARALEQALISVRSLVVATSSASHLTDGFSIGPDGMPCRKVVPATPEDGLLATIDALLSSASPAATPREPRDLVALVQEWQQAERLNSAVWADGADEGSTFDDAAASTINRRYASAADVLLAWTPTTPTLAPADAPPQETDIYTIRVFREEDGRFAAEYFSGDGREGGMGEYSVTPVGALTELTMTLIKVEEDKRHEGAPADAPTETRTCGNCKHFDIVCRNATAIGYAAVNLTSDDGCLKGFTPKDGPR